MAEATSLTHVYEGAIKTVKGYSIDETGRVYSFWWMYSPGVVRVGLCRGVVVEARQEADTILYNVYSSTRTSCWEESLESRIAFILGAREDYSVFHEKASQDPLASCIPRQLSGFRLRAQTPWASLLTAVAQQNASFQQGWSMLYRLYTTSGRKLKGPGWVYLEPPAPSPAVYEAAKSSGYGFRANTIAVLAQLATRLGEDNPELVEAALEVKGVGPYTYNLARLFSLKDYNALPLDKWLQQLAAKAYNIPVREVAREVTRRFGEWRGLLALAATICFDAEVLHKALERLERGENQAGLRPLSPISLWKYFKPGD